MQIVVCDDITQEALETARHLQRYLETKKIGSITINIVDNGVELWRYKDIDLLFLDIELSNESGIALAKEVNQKSPNTMIIFVSSYPFYVTDTYRVDAVQFLVKPLQNDVFEQVMDQVMVQYQKKQAYYVRRCEGEPMSIRKNQIVFIKAQKRILNVYLANGKLLEYYGTLNEEAQLLEEYGVIRCHKGYLVNLNFVQRLDRKGIVVKLPDDKIYTVPVGESMYDAVYAAYLKFMCE